jgi:hypothetical protein
MSDEIDQLPNISPGNQGLLSNQSQVNYFFYLLIICFFPKA